jgi:drug/metabolite transporter (DMT)-like permease
VGILVALAGTVVIAGDGSVGSAAIFGNVLALVGAVTVAVYVLIEKLLPPGHWLDRATAAVLVGAGGWLLVAA